ncbi:MAG: hypothetical protein M3P39_03060 [Actinomycetota bacterium]|nr:hypothetical protein [Actinomycetota bacterium]
MPAPNEIERVPTREQVDGAARFDGGEGMWYDSGTVYFTTKGDGRVWALDTVAGRLAVLYDSARARGRRCARSTTCASPGRGTCTCVRTATTSPSA